MELSNCRTDGIDRESMISSFPTRHVAIVAGEEFMDVYGTYGSIVLMVLVSIDCYHHHPSSYYVEVF